MRPQSIINFERVVLLSLAFGILSAFLSWDQIQANVAATGFGGGFVIGVQAVTIAVYLLLLWFISRHGSPVAKWIYVVLAVAGLLFGLAGIGQTFAMGAVSAVLTIVQYVLTLVSLWLLFRPDAKAWFAEGRGEIDPDSLR